MNLSINHQAFLHNLKFWSIHSLINSIPSLVFAYQNDWNTPTSFIAMGLGIIIFILMLTYFLSMNDIHEFCSSELMARAIRAGLKFRIILCILSLPVIISFITLTLGGPKALAEITALTGIVWAPDFVLGIVSHSFYQQVKEIIPIQGAHNFIPTVIITILQGIFLMIMLITAGLILTSLGLGKIKTANKNIIINK